MISGAHISASGQVPDGAAETKRKRHVVNQAASACANCSRLKVRCEVESGSMICARCVSCGTECTWRASKRGKWSRASSVARKKVEEDSVVDHIEIASTAATESPHFETPAEESCDHGGAIHFKVDSSLYPMGLLAEFSLKMDQLCSTQSPALTGPAAPNYFRHGLNTQFRDKPEGVLPKVLENEIITEVDASALFDLFFQHCNPLINLLDPNLCPAKTCSTRSPFLFTAICAVASRFYKGGALYPPLMRHARTSGLQAMLDAKNTYTVQAFLILAYWTPPAATYEQDNSFLFAGIAIRLGQEIGLHHKNTISSFPKSMSAKLRLHYEAEMLNRERTWFCCFIIDRSSCAMSGKPDTIFEKFLIRSSSTWYDQPGTGAGDIYLCAVVEIQRIVWRILDVIYSSSKTKSAISPSVNYYIITEDLAQRLDDWHAIWDQKLVDRDQSHLDTHYYRAMLRFYMNFYKLIPLSIGLANCFQREQPEMDAIMFCEPCFHGASEVVSIVTTDSSVKTRLKYAHDHWTAVLAFCACFLLKLLDLPYARRFDRKEIIRLATAAAEALEEVSEDQEHTPFAYAAFIRKRLTFEHGRVQRSLGMPNLGQPQPATVFTLPSLADDKAAAEIDNVLSTDWWDTLLSQQDPSIVLDNGADNPFDFSIFDLHGGANLC